MLAQFIRKLLHLFLIIRQIVRRILAHFHRFTVVDGQNDDRFVDFFANHLEHGREQQKSDERHRHATQRGHHDARSLLENDILVPVIEEQRIAYAQQDGKNRQPERILCK